MYDFTKEELEILKRALTHWVGENAGQIIKDKLQSMINNYCEHEGVPCNLVDEGGTLKMQQCTKCGVFFK
jgi:hypothetical protein